MKIDTEGIYTLQYTAEDECGNVTIEERTVNVISLKTVLFTDGTLIINEKSTDRAANIALHGAVTNEYVYWAKVRIPGESDTYNTENGDIPWKNEKGSVKSVKFGSAVYPRQTSTWFMGHTALEQFDKTNLYMNDCVNMNQMFDGCTALTACDLSGLDTSKVTTMQALFRNCRNISTVSIAIDTSSVTDMRSAFSHCSALTALDLSSFNTSNVSNMSGMFAECSSLTSLDLSNFDTSNNTSMNYMFSNCSALTYLDVSSFDTSKVTDMTQAFGGCRLLTSLDVSSFTADALTTANSMFYQCRAVTMLDVSNFNPSNNAIIASMFRFCVALVTIYASSDWSGNTHGSDMFDGTERLVGGAGSRWNYRYIDSARAKIDGGSTDKGYFTAKP